MRMYVYYAFDYGVVARFITSPERHVRDRADYGMTYTECFNTVLSQRSTAPAQSMYSKSVYACIR